MNAAVIVLLPMTGMKSRATMAVATNNEANTPQAAMGFGISFDFRNRKKNPAIDKLDMTKPK